jgi:hypothetical protein
MRCDEFEERIHEALDRRIAPESQQGLTRHAQTCKSCSELLADYEQLCDGLCFCELPAPRKGFSERVVARYSVLRLRRRRIRVATAAALAAAVAFMFILPRLLWQPALERIAVPDTVPARESLASSSSPNSGQRMVRPKSSAESEQEGIDVEQANLFWDQWATRLKTDRWKRVDQIAGEFAPITEPLSVAIDEIRSTIPIGRSSRSAESSPDSAEVRQVPSVWLTA